MRALLWIVGVVGLLGAQAASAEDKVTLSVQSTGSGAKQVLRYAVPAGTTQQVRFSMDMSTTTAMMGQTLPIELPTLTSKLTADSTAAPEGTHIDVRYEEVAFASKPSGMAAMIATPLSAALTGATASLTLDPTGVVHDLEVKVATAVADNKGADALDLDRWIVPLPSEPMGVGGRWTALVEGEAPNGLKITAETTYTVTAITAAGVSLDLAVKSSLEPGSIDAQGMKATVTSATTTGTGAQQVRFDRLFPSTAHLTLASEMLLDVQGMSTSQSTAIKLSIAE